MADGAQIIKLLLQAVKSVQILFVFCTQYVVFVIVELLEEEQVERQLWFYTFCSKPTNLGLYHI